MPNALIRANRDKNQGFLPNIKQAHHPLIREGPVICKFVCLLQEMVRWPGKTDLFMPCGFDKSFGEIALRRCD